MEIDIIEKLSSFFIKEYPKVIFNFSKDDLKLTIGQAVKCKKVYKNPRGYPDLFIAQPVGSYAGMYLEVKDGYDKLFTKSGKMRKSEHITEQRNMLRRLAKAGFNADFCISYEDCVSKIDDYLGGKM